MTLQTSQMSSARPTVTFDMLQIDRERPASPDAGYEADISDLESDAEEEAAAQEKVTVQMDHIIPRTKISNSAIRNMFFI